MESLNCYSIKFTGPVEKEGNYYVARCNQLPISAFGKTEDEAGQKIVETIGLYLKTHNELGQLKDIIKRYNLNLELEYKTTPKGFEAKCPVPA